MLVLAMLLVACAGACARNFNITYFFVPHLVTPDQHEAKIECEYDANFTVLSWFKGANEFFRYRPGAAPTTRSFPILGIGTVEMLQCGPVACQLKLGELTREATGVYRCDLERDVPPYKYATVTGYMEVHGDVVRKPSLEGLAEEYKEGDIIKAYCRGTPDSEIRWYLNSVEIEECRGSPYLVKKSTLSLYMGSPPTVLVQCVEFRHGWPYGSRELFAKWSEGNELRKKKVEVVKNGSVATTGRLGWLSILCFLEKVLYELCSC